MATIVLEEWNERKPSAGRSRWRIRTHNGSAAKFPSGPELGRLLTPHFPGAKTFAVIEREKSHIVIDVPEEIARSTMEAFTRTIAAHTRIER